MRLIDHTASPYTARAAAGLPASFGRIARQLPLDPALVPAHAAVAAVATRVPGVPVPHADRPRVTRLHDAARRARDRQAGDLFARGLRFVRAAVVGLVDAWQRARQRHATTRALGQLDARALRDLGLDRSELLSAAYDLERDDFTTRLRTVRGANALRLF